MVWRRTPSPRPLIIRDRISYVRERTRRYHKEKAWDAVGFGVDNMCLRPSSLNVFDTKPATVRTLDVLATLPRRGRPDRTLISMFRSEPSDDVMLTTFSDARGVPVSSRAVWREFGGRRRLRRCRRVVPGHTRARDRRFGPRWALGLAKPGHLSSGL